MWWGKSCETSLHLSPMRRIRHHHTWACRLLEHSRAQRSINSFILNFKFLSKLERRTRGVKWNFKCAECLFILFSMKRFSESNEWIWIAITRRANWYGYGISKIAILAQKNLFFTQLCWINLDVRSCRHFAYIFFPLVLHLNPPTIIDSEIRIQCAEILGM